MTKEQVFNMLDKAILKIHHTFCEDECEYILTEQLKDAKFPFSWSVECGVSKAVILIKGESYVIKLPFTTFYDYEAYSDAHYYWNEERDEVIAQAEVDNLSNDELQVRLHEFDKTHPEPDASDERWYYDLEGASYIHAIEIESEYDWNYCHLETEIYRAALEQGLGAYFAEEGFLGRLDCGHPVYYQQRCTPLSSLEYDYSSVDYEKKSRRARKTCEDNEIYCFNPLWIADFLDMYGLDEFKRLNVFLKEMDIGDLRDCNIGYLDGAPILFDYSGFRQWD